MAYQPYYTLYHIHVIIHIYVTINRFYITRVMPAIFLGSI